MNNLKYLPIKSFCKTGSGGTPSRQKIDRYYENGVIPWVKSGELRESIILDTEEKITDFALKETSVKMVPKGALLVAMYGATIGRIATLGVDATTNQAVCHIIPDINVADPRYLFYALSNQVPTWINQGVGGAQPNISQQIIKETKIPLPPIAQQKRIAAILDKADAVRRKRREAIRLTEELLRSTFLEMFGNYLNDGHTETFHEVSDLLIDCRNKTAPYSESGIPLIRTTNFKNGELILDDLKYVTKETNKIWSSRHQVSPGDIVYCREAPFGMAAIIPDGFYPCLGQRIMVSRPNLKKVMPEFLWFVLNSSFVYEQAQRVAVGSTVKHLRVADVNNLNIPVPPIDLQVSFSLLVKRNQSLKTGLSSHIEELENLFDSLLQRAFTGNL